MTLRRLIFTSAVVLALGANARQLSVSDVMPIANSLYSNVKSNNMHNLKLAYTATNDNGNALYYVLNREGGNGYIVMAADDCSQPILANITSGEFNYATAPEALRFILDSYAHSISNAIENGQSTRTITNTNRTDVAPMIETAWGQEAPFNNLCPPYNGNQRAAVGCVALAMAQVMKYHEHPAQGTGSHSYTYNGNTYSADFGATTYRWDLMTPNGMYMGVMQDRENAISTLTYHCGVSIDMMYNWGGGYGSAAYAKDIPNALMTYFDYANTARYLKASDDSNFEETLYQELAASRPVVMEGFPSPGVSGHTFICHGYSSADNTFYLNLGATGGNGDGYYALNHLAGWSYGVGVVIGIQPNENGGSGGGTGGDTEDKYATNFDDSTITRSDRSLKSITITSPTHGAQVIDVPHTLNQDPVVVDLTATNTITVKQDEEITFDLDYEGSWMNSYVYIDANGNGFTADVDDNGVAGSNNELISYSNYNKKNSRGETSSESDPNTLPSFTVPSSLYAGTYRMRVKIDWNNIDPKGSTAADNRLDANGGRIVDFLLKVEESATMVTKKFNFVADGMTIAQRTLRLKIGDQYPTFDKLDELQTDYYTISGYPTEPVSDVNNETITLTVTQAFPFKISKGASASSATWYTLTVNGNYVRYNPNNPDVIAFDSNSSASPYQENGKIEDTYVWCFTGNLYSGVQIWNRRAQSPLTTLTNGTSQYVSADAEFDLQGKCSAFHAIKVDDSSFYLELNGSDNLLYSAGTAANGWLSCGTDTEDRALVVITEVKRSNIAAVESIIADKDNNNHTIYDLLGRPVANPTPGLYIINGKKTVIR